MEYKVYFRKGNEETNITLYSHYTCIIGKYSGEGKSEFLAELANEIAEGNKVFESELTVSIADAASLPGILNNPNRQIVIIDEMAMLQRDVIARINESHHLFIGVSRGNPIKLDYPLKGIYSVERTANWYKISSLQYELPLVDQCKDCKIVMESRKNKSEHELLSKYFSNCIAASGKNNIEKYLRNKDDEICVFADLGAIGNAFTILRKRCNDNPKIKFYDYQAFEQLLVESPLLSDYASECSVFDFMTLERFYEHELEEAFKSHEIKFKHGADLPDLIRKASITELFNSGVGRKLLEYIEVRERLNKIKVQEVSSF